MAAGVQKYMPEIVKNVSWAGPQSNDSLALKWTEQYQPVPKIWAAPPVRRFVEHIQRNGLKGSPKAEAEGIEPNQVAERASVDSLVRPPRLDLPSVVPDPTDLDPRGCPEPSRTSRPSSGPAAGRPNDIDP